MQRYWENKIVVITGASSGIGLLTAKKAGERGAVPVLLGRSADRLHAAASAAGIPSAAVFQADVAAAEQVNEAMDAVIRTYGRIDVLINNAGYGVFERFVDTDLATFEDMMNVNYMGTVRCLKAVIPHMLQVGKGHIVNIASLAGKFSTAKAGGYAATKHAVLGLTNSLRMELAGTGITITAVNPGPVRTPFMDRADPDGAYLKRMQRFVLEPEYVAEEVVKGVEKAKAEVNIPFVASAGVKLYQLFPVILSRVAGKLVDKK